MPEQQLTNDGRPLWIYTQGSTVGRVIPLGRCAEIDCEHCQRHRPSTSASVHGMRKPPTRALSEPEPFRRVIGPALKDLLVAAVSLLWAITKTSNRKASDT